MTRGKREQTAGTTTSASASAASAAAAEGPGAAGRINSAFTRGATDRQGRRIKH